MSARAIFALAATLVAAPAGATELLLHDGWLLEPQAGTFYENGIGSPTVAYDRANDLWVMYFETQIGPADPVGCKGGVWGIGRATSPDGLDWTIDADLVLEPQTGTYYGCTVAHPEVVYDGTQFRLFFKAEQPANTCALTDPDPTWGCRPITGVGYATSTDGVTGWVVTPEPILAIPSFGFPTVAKVGGTWRMLLAYSSAQNDIYELWESVSQDDGVTWSPPEVVVTPGFAPWVSDEIYNPALTCRNDDPWKFVLWTGGRDTIPGPTRTIRTAGLGRAFSADGVEWPFDAGSPYQQWNLDPTAGPVDKDWRHWDAVRIGDDYLIFFTQKDDANHNRVGLAYTYATQQTSFAEKRISDRICSTPEEQDTALPDPGDTDGDTDADSDVAGDTDGDTDDTGEGKDGGKQCRCDTGTPAGLAWGAALVALALRRRSRPRR